MTVHDMVLDRIERVTMSYVIDFVCERLAAVNRAILAVDKRFVVHDCHAYQTIDQTLATMVLWSGQQGQDCVMHDSCHYLCDSMCWLWSIGRGDRI